MFIFLFIYISDELSSATVGIYMCVKNYKKNTKILNEESEQLEKLRNRKKLTKPEQNSYFLHLLLFIARTQ